MWIVYLLKSEPLVWSFWGEQSRVANLWKECWETDWLLLKWMSFAFLLESLIVAPIPAEKVTQWFGGGDSGRTIPFSPTIDIPAYLNGNAVIPLVAGRLRISALGRVFNANLTSCPEHATLYAEVINTYP